MREIEDRLLTWARQSGLLTDPGTDERFRKAEFGKFASFVYPNASDVLVYAKWLAWLFVVDDQYDENRIAQPGGIELGVSAYLPMAGERAKTPDQSVTATLVNLWQELSEQMPAPLQDRFRANADIYTRSYATEIAEARDSSAPQLGPYIELRRSSGAVDTCLDLIERRPEAYLTYDQAKSPQIDALRCAANDIICWSNDIMSLAKEFHHGEMNNLVAVVRGATGMSWQAALDVAREMVAARTREFINIRDQIHESEHNSAVYHFIDGLENWIAGSLTWHRYSARYNRGLV